MMSSFAEKRKSVPLWLVLVLVSVLTSTTLSDASTFDDRDRLENEGLLRALGMVNDNIRDPATNVMKADDAEQAALIEARKQQHDIVAKAAVEAAIPQTDEVDMPDAPPLPPGSIKRELDILAMGGSVTWGASLENRLDAYPHVVAKLYEMTVRKYKPEIDLKTTVDNLAIRATGADYPSLCLQTLLSDVEKEHGVSAKSYDIILLDFCLNGMDGFSSLLFRLRSRYPDAIIVLIELWSPKAGALRDGDTQESVVEAGMDDSRPWVWSERMQPNYNPPILQNAKKALEEYGGLFFRLPQPADVRQILDEHWFYDGDWHHLSKKGHLVLAASLFNQVLKHEHNVLNPQKEVVPWGRKDLGDQCYNWFISPDVSLPYEGPAYMRSIAGGTKHFLEVNYDVNATVHDPMVMTFDSPFNIPVRLYIGFMSQVQPANYPRADVTLRHIQGSGPDGASNSTAVMKRVFPSFNRLRTNPMAHVTSYTMIGQAMPGKNELQVLPLEDSEWPFRLVGVYMRALLNPDEAEQTHDNEMSQQGGHNTEVTKPKANRARRRVQHVNIMRQSI